MVLIVRFFPGKILVNGITQVKGFEIEEVIGLEVSSVPGVEGGVANIQPVMGWLAENLVVDALESLSGVVNFVHHQNVPVVTQAVQ